MFFVELFNTHTTFYLAELFHCARLYFSELFFHTIFCLDEVFRHATFYLAELFRHATFYLAKQFRQIASLYLKVICTIFDIGALNDPHIFQTLNVLLFFHLSQK